MISLKSKFLFFLGYGGKSMFLSIIDWILLSLYSAYVMILIILRVIAYISFVINLILWLTDISPYRAKRRTIFSLILIVIIEYLIAHSMP